MRRTRRTGDAAAADVFRPSLLGLPGSFLQQLIASLSPDSKLAFRATCKQCMSEVEQASGSALQLRLCSRIPSIHSIHAVNMLAHVSVLDTAAASRGAVSVGWPGSVQQACAVLPALRTARLNSSQASLVELLLHAAPQLSRIELSVTGVTPTVVRLLARLPALASLDLQLAHPGWAKACAGLGALSQLQQLSIAGRPMDEAARHGEGCVSCSFWESCIAPLCQLSSLSVNPWIKALPGAPAASYSSLGKLRQLSVPYCSGKAGQAATAATLAQLAAHCSELTALTIGVHEFNWDISGLSALTGLRQLELHNPFLKEVWGLAPCTAAHLAPLTAARHLTALTISTLRLPLLSDVMAAAGLAPGAAALVSGPGKPAAAAAALGAVGGPAFGDMVTAIAIAAVAAAMRSTAQPGTAAALAAADLQAAAAVAIAHAAAQVPQHLSLVDLTRLAAAADLEEPTAAAAAGADPDDQQQQQAQQEEHAADGSSGLWPGAAPAGAAGRLARKVVQAVAAHISGAAGSSAPAAGEAGAAAAAAVAAAEEPATLHEIQSARHAAIALATAIAPSAAAAAAAALFSIGGTPAPPGLQAAVQQQAMHAGAAAAAAADNALAPVVAGGGAPAAALGFVAVPVVPPPPPPPPVAQAAAVLAAMAGQQQQQQLGGAPPLLLPDSADGVQHHQQQRQRAASAADIAGAAAAAAASAASALLGQLPVLLQLRRLTVGTTHGKFMSGVSIAALAPNLTAFEDLSEIMRQPLYATDALAGLNQLKLLTVNVDTLQLHVSSSGSLTALSNMAADSTAASSSGSDASKQQQQPVGAAAPPAAPAAAVPSKPRQRQRRQQQPTKAAAQAGSHAGLPAAVAQPQQQQQPPSLQEQQPCLQDEQQQQQQQRCPPLLPLVDPAVWRGLGQLQCLRLLMLGHVHSDLLPSEGGRVLPRIAGITRLELCSAFGGRPEYAATYSIAEDPALWQEQVGVRELVVDGGVLLGGFLVDSAMAALLKRQMRQLQTLVLARCPDLDISHLKDAVTRRLAPCIVVRRDCGGVDEAQVVALAQGLGARCGVVLEMAGPAPGEYADKSYSYAVDD